MSNAIPPRTPGSRRRSSIAGWRSGSGTDDRRPATGSPLLPALVVSVLALAWSGPARAARATWIVEEDQPHPEFMLTALGGWYLMGFGAEGRISFPVGPNGAIDYLNESFALEVGAGYQFFLDESADFQRVTFPLLVRWDFHLTTLWTVYGALGAAGGLPIDREDPAVFGYHGYVWLVAAIGAFLHLGSGVSLRMEGGSLGILAGLTWAF